MGGFVYYGSSTLLKKLQIDDPLDAAPVHFFCGIWGVLSVGLFAEKSYTKDVYGKDEDSYGAFMGGGGKQLGNQIIGVLAIIGWVCFTCSIVFGSLKALKLLRVSAEDEEVGLDSSHHGGDAYNFEAGRGNTVS